MEDVRSSRWFSSSIESEVGMGRVAGQCLYSGTRYASRYVQELTARLLEVIWHLGGSAAL